MTTPGAFPQPPPLSDAEPPASPYPDFTPVDASFALELRAESIEQLTGGDALRRGESERIEAGRSDGNADLVGGRDRVQVRGTVTEHTGRSLAVQTAHLDTTVDNASDTCAGKEDTVLLAGHMRDTWNGGSATVAAMCDDLAVGGGVRANALDLWVHGLMGLEERPGTCTADGALFEACGTLYEREYRTAVHAAGLAVFNGTLYQSVRNSFRPLMRISTGVRNLVAGGGGGGGGDAPPAPPAAGGAGADGAEGAGAAAETLAAGRGAAQTPQTGREAARLDVTEVLPPEAVEGGIVAVPDDPSEIRHGADTAERLEGLREGLARLRLEPTSHAERHLTTPELPVGSAGSSLEPSCHEPRWILGSTVTIRGAQECLGGSDAGDETASGARASEAAAATSGSRLVDPPGYLDGRPAAVALDPAVPVPRVGDPRTRGGKVKLGLRGGADEPPRRKPDDFDWATAYQELTIEYRQQLVRSDRPAVDAYSQALTAIEAKVMEEYQRHGGRPIELEQRSSGVALTEAAYHDLQGKIQQAERASEVRVADTIRRSLTIIDQFTYERVFDLELRFGDIESPPPAALRPGVMRPGGEPRALRLWLDVKMDRATDTARNASERHDTGAEHIALHEFAYFEHVRDDVARGIDPEVSSRREIQALRDAGHVVRAEQAESLHVRLAQAIANLASDPWAPRPLVAATGGTRHAAGGLSPGVGVAGFEFPGRSVGPVSISDAPAPVHRITLEVGPSFPEPSGEPVRIPHVSEPPAAPGPSGPAPTVPAGTATGGTATHPVSAMPAVTPHQGAEAAFWLRPAEPMRAAGTVQFDPGLHRVGEQPAATAPELSELDFSAQWTVDDFAVERALIAGRLPPGFDASGLISEWRWVAVGTPLAGQLEGGLLPFTTIDSMIEGYRSVDQAGAFALFTRQLQHMRESVARALSDAYGHRADPGWLAEVDESLRVRSASQAADAASGTGSRELDDIIGAAHASSRREPLESTAASSRIEAGAGMLLRPDDSWRSRAPGMRSGQDPVRFGDDRTAGAASVPATPATSRAGVPQGWHAGESPGFGRPTSTHGEFPFSRREQIVHRLVTGEALSQAQISELTRRFGAAIAAGEIGSSAPHWRTAFLRDLRRLAIAARTSPATAAALEDVDWSAIAALLRLLDAPARSR